MFFFVCIVTGMESSHEEYFLASELSSRIGHWHDCVIYSPESWRFYQLFHCFGERKPNKHWKSANRRLPTHSQFFCTFNIFCNIGEYSLYENLVSPNYSPAMHFLYLLQFLFFFYLVLARQSIIKLKLNLICTSFNPRKSQVTKPIAHTQIEKNTETIWDTVAPTCQSKSPPMRPHLSLQSVSGKSNIIKKR